MTYLGAIWDSAVLAWQAGRFYVNAARDVANEVVFDEHTTHALDYAEDIGVIPTVTPATQEDIAQAFAMYVAETPMLRAPQQAAQLLRDALPWPWWVYAGGAALVLAVGGGVALRVGTGRLL